MSPEKLKYAIIDVETTGMGIQGNKITEIAIIIHDGTKIIDQYDSLVNPECTIPMTISRLTGIYDYMVSDAPKFYEVAKKVIEITKDCIFVAHNVNFDYNVIHKEFSDLGFPFKRKKLCTVRLSRKLIPGLPSYSLGKLCSSVGIRINDRHRAKGDADATTILFEKLLRLDADNKVFDSFLKPNSREATLPPGLAKEIFEKLPERTGVYYFRNEKEHIIYVGKALNIKKECSVIFMTKRIKKSRFANKHPISPLRLPEASWSPYSLSLLKLKSIFLFIIVLSADQMKGMGYLVMRTGQVLFIWAGII